MRASKVARTCKIKEMVSYREPSKMPHYLAACRSVCISVKSTGYMKTLPFQQSCSVDTVSGEITCSGASESLETLQHKLVLTLHLNDRKNFLSQPTYDKTTRPFVSRNQQSTQRRHTGQRRSSGKTVQVNRDLYRSLKKKLSFKTTDSTLPRPPILFYLLKIWTTLVIIMVLEEIG